MSFHSLLNPSSNQVLLLGFQLLEMVIVKTPNTYVNWEMWISITHFELCVKCSAHREMAGRGMTLFIFRQSCLSLWEKSALSWKSRQRHSTTTTPFPSTHTPLSLSTPCVWFLTEQSRSTCVQLRELLLRWDSVPCRFNVPSCCCLCCKALYRSFKSALSHMLSLFYIDPSKSIRASWPFVNLLG